MHLSMFSLRGVGPGIPREFDSISSPMAGGIVENLTKLVIPRVGMFDNWVVQEPGT